MKDDASIDKSAEHSAAKEPKRRSALLECLVLLFKKREPLSDDRTAVNERMKKLQATSIREPKNDSILLRNKPRLEAEKTEDQLSLAEMIRKRLDDAKVRPLEVVSEIHKEMSGNAIVAGTVELSQARRWRSLRLKLELDSAATPVERFTGLDPWTTPATVEPIPMPVPGQPAEPVAPPFTSQQPMTEPFFVAEQLQNVVALPAVTPFTWSAERPLPLPQPQRSAPIGEPAIDSRAIPIAEISSFLDIIFAEPRREPSPQAETDVVKPTALAVQQTTFDRLSVAEPKEKANGHITALGPFLLDKKCEQAVQSLIANASSRTRVLTLEESGELTKCLQPIGALDGVAGCIILGYDGIVIANTLPKHCDLDVFSSWALVTYMSSHNAVEILGHGRVQQIVSRTIGGIMLLADFGQGLLLAVSDKTTTDAVLPLMRGVRKVTAA